MSVADLSAKSMTSIIENMEKAGIYTTDRAEDEVPELRQLIAKRLLDSASSQENKKKKNSATTATATATATATPSNTQADANIKHSLRYRPTLGELESFSPQSFRDFTFPLAKNASKNDLVFETMLQSAETMVVDVQPDGSCLFHAVFASLWHLLTGRFLQRYSHAPLDDFWKATRLYDVENAFAAFEHRQYEAVLGAIWHACTRSMRLYVATSLAFGTQTRTRDEIEALVRRSACGDSAKETMSDQYLLSMLQTIVCSVSLERVSFALAAFLEEEREDEKDRDRQKSVLLSIAMAAQQLLTRVEHDTAALRQAIKSFKGDWCSDASTEKQSSFRVLASEGYEDAWFDVDGDKTRASCFAMTFDSNPSDRILFAKSYWASISACGLLSSALGFNIYVVVPDRSEKTLRIESFESVGNDANKHIYLYMLGNREHFGYGATTKCTEEKEEQTETLVDACLIRLLKNLCGNFIVDHRETYVAYIYDDLRRWFEHVSDGDDEETDRGGEEEEAEEKKWFSMIFSWLQNDSASFKKVGDVLQSTDVVSLAWTSTMPLSASSLSSASAEQKKNTLNAAIAQLVGESDLSMIAFMFAYKFKSAYVDFSDNIETPTLALLKARFQRTACPFRQRYNYLLRVRDARPFPLYVDAMQSTIRFLIDNTVTVDPTFVALIKHYNKWHDEHYEPLSNALQRDCETALRFVIARMRRSLAQPGVVPLFVLGEQMFFCDSRLFALDFATDYAGSVNAVDLHLYQLDADDDSALTVQDIVSGSKVARLVNVKSKNLVAELAYLVCDSLITIILHEKEEDIGVLTNALVFATGVQYADERFDHRLDAVQRAASESADKLRSQSGVYRQTIRNAQGVVTRGGVLGIHALAMFDPRVCMREHFGWFGAHLRCATFVPGRGFVDLLGLVPIPELASDAKAVLPRLAVRFYALYKSFADPSKRQRFRPLLLRSEENSHRVSAVDAAQLLSPLLVSFPELRAPAMVAVYGSVEQSRRAFFGHAPTDWCLYYHLQSFFAANADPRNVDALFEPQTFSLLRESMLYGTAGERRDALVQSLGIEDGEEND